MRGGEAVEGTRSIVPQAHPSGPPATESSLNRQHFGCGTQAFPGETPCMPHVVIPVLNEAGALPDLLAAMPPGYTAVVADNGSTDGSGDIARRFGAVVVDQPVR